MVSSYVLLHVYFAGWFIKVFSLLPQTGRFLRLTLLSLAFLSPFTMFLRRHCENIICEYISFLGALWMGIVIILAFSIASHDIIIFIAKKFSPFNHLSHSHIVALFMAILMIVFSIYSAFLTPNIRRININIHNLPESMNNLKIVQISDMHIDFHYNIGQFEAIVEKINTTKPDLVLMTGDFLDPPMACNGRITKAVKNIETKFGIFAVTGNHEYYYGYKKSVECYKKLGVRLLTNEISKFDDFQIIGFNDIRTTKMTEDDIKKIINKSNKNKFSIIMSHQPRFFDMMAENINFFALSGHTHRGQIFPFNILTKITHKHFYGLYKINNSYLYATSGLGSWGPKMRFLAPTEIPLITLSKN